MFTHPEGFLKYVSEKNVDAVDLKFSDLHGRWHHITLPAEGVNDMIFKRGIGFDGSSIPGFTATESGDLVLIPDPGTAFLDPFWNHKVLSVICWINEAGSGKPYERDPRGVFQRAIDYLREKDIADQTLWIPELEFYVFDRVEYNNHSNVAYHRIYSVEAYWDQEVHTGHKVARMGGYHAIPPVDQLYIMRQKMSSILGDIGYPTKYHHHEVGGAGQCEIEFPLTPDIRGADAVLVGKYIIKMVAYKEGKSATFMPKPVYGEAGNGLHFHILLNKKGKPIFHDSDGYAHLSKTCLSFIAGILNHGRSLAAFTNPSTNSYKRLIPGFEAPSNLFFSVANRSAAIRIPKYAVSPDQKRFEYRPPDATCNPYLCMAALLMAGAEGVLADLNPKRLRMGPFDDNIFKWDEARRNRLKALPASLREALNDLDTDKEYLMKGGVFSKDLINAWYVTKEKEANDIQQRPHPYEFHTYYTV